MESRPQTKQTRPDTMASRARSNRPDTAGSRQAWTEPSAFDIPGTPSEKSGSQNEMLNSSQGKFGAMWGMAKGILSGSSEDESPEDRYIKTTLRELMIYIVFLVDLCVLSFGMSSPTMYYYTKVMTELFVDGSTPDFGKTFRGMTSIEDVWSFAEGPLMDGLYWDKWYDGRNASEDGFIFYENKLLGLPRIRTLRVRPDSCAIPEAFEREIKECFDEYSEEVEDTRNYGKLSDAERNATAWNYQSEDELDGDPYWAKLTRYGGGGFVADLKLSRVESEAIIAQLKKGRWLDRGTRALFIDFTVYNANINLFCMVKLVVEFPPTGGVLPSYTVRSAKLIRYVSAMDFFVMACEGIFVLFTVYYIIEIALEARKLKRKFASNPWNVLDTFMMVIAVSSIAFSVYRQLTVDNKLTSLLENQNQYAKFEFLGFAASRFTDAVGVMVFFAWIKIFKYISFNKTMNQLSSTLSRCAKDIGGFAVMFFIFFFAYVQLGYLIFGSQVEDFSTFYDSTFTLLRTILGDFNFEELEQANRVLGPIFFITYIFFVFFVLLNMFLAIINDTYSEVKEELANQKNEFELASYFKRGYNNMMRKLHLKKDRIVDIQQALGSADANGDENLDFEEWRQELKRRGYAEQEIEAMFSRYDVDGDRVLGAEEQRMMRRDLNQEKALIEDEMAQPRTKSETDNFEDFDDPTLTAAAREEVTALQRRVDRMEHSLTSVVNKMDSILEAVSRKKDESDA